MSANWKTNPLLLAEKLVKRIAEDGETSIDQLDARAAKLGIEPRIMDQALERLHKGRKIQQKTKKGTIYYAVKVKKPKEVAKKYHYELDDYHKSIIADGAPIPFYNPEFDGPSPVYGPEYNAWCRKKNEDLKRKVERDQFKVNKNPYARKAAKARPMTAEQNHLISLFPTS